MRRKRRTPAKKPAPTVAFRLPSPYCERLTQEAAKVQMSVGEFARRLVIEQLTDDTEARVLEEVAGIREAIDKLDEHVAAATIAILHDAGKADLAAAVRWVHRNLTPENLTRSYPDQD